MNDNDNWTFNPLQSLNEKDINKDESQKNIVLNDNDDEEYEQICNLFFLPFAFTSHISSNLFNVDQLISMMNLKYYMILYLNLLIYFRIVSKRITLRYEN
jgi:hypothetical protein